MQPTNQAVATTPASRVQAFYDAYHQGRVRKPNRWMERVYWRLLAGSVLEVGAGTLLPSHPRIDPYVALDFSLQAGIRARRQGHTAVAADGQALPFANRSFDTVSCYDVLEHVVDPPTLLAELCRVARQRVVIAGPNYVGLEHGGLDRYLPIRLWHLTRVGRRTWSPLPDPHLRFDSEWAPDRDAISAANSAWVSDRLRAHGFRPVQCGSWSHSPYPMLDTVPMFRHLGPFMVVVAEAT